MRRGGWKKKQIPCDFPVSIALPDEEWRPVIGWERFYQVSSLGRVFSLHQTGRLITGLVCRGGYRVLKLRDGERKAYAMTHVLVLETFVGPRPSGYHGCHGNGDSGDNRLANLRWDTISANQADRQAHGRGNYRGPHALTADNVRLIRTSPDATDKEWAERFGVSVMAILQARTGTTWTNVDTPPLVRTRT